MNRESPGLVVPPPLIYLPAILVGFVTNYFWPVALLPSIVQYVGGGIIIVFSVAIMPLVLSEFSRAKTHFDARKPVTH